MAMALFERGREGFLGGTLDWDTQTFAAALIDTGTADVGIKAITGATNATPIVITATAHGFSNGDIVSVEGVLGNLAANGLWVIASVAANTFALTDPVSGANAVGSAAYTSGGYAVCLGPSASGDNWDDFDAALVGSLVTLTSPTITSGIADAADVTFPTVSGATVEAVAILRNTGTPATSTMVAWQDGRHIVTCAAQAASSATTVAVERLQAAIPNSTVLTFSNGASATLSALANAGDRTLTVTALAAIITAGSRASAPQTASGLPVTPNGGNIVWTLPATGPWGASPGVFKL
jgi:hypothetical protein